MAALTQENCARCLNRVILLLILNGVLPISLHTISNEPPEPSDPAVHGSILTPLLKVLSENEPWPDLSARARPESRYVRYMKRLYKMSSKQERSHEASHLYNTVRLITPRDACLEQNEGRLNRVKVLMLHEMPKLCQLLRAGSHSWEKGK